MSRPGWNGRAATAAPRSAGLTLLIVMAAGGASVEAQQGPQGPPPAPATLGAPPGAAVVAPPGAGGPAVISPTEVATVAGTGALALSPDIQVVRFQGPEGMSVEVLGPNPTPVPQGDGRGILTVGL